MLNKFTDGIMGLDEASMSIAKKKLDSLAKPIGSLGRLEELAVRLYGISSGSQFSKKTIVIMCADNGVYEEKLSLAPQEVTYFQACNFHSGKTGVGVLAGLVGAQLKVIDIGVNYANKCIGAEDFRIANGTKNLLKEPAMSMEQCLRAVETGFNCAVELKTSGVEVIGTGEMGICNTTTASLIVTALTGCSPDEAVGRGSGIDNEMLQRKRRVVMQALELHKPDKTRPLEVLQKLGGFDIAGLTGLFLGAAKTRLPIVIDGVISIAAALVAAKIEPKAKDFMIPSHMSEEPGHKYALKHLGLEPYFHFDMRLGEGSGCPFTFFAIDSACAIMNNMATFDEGHIESKGFIDIREEEQL